MNHPPPEATRPAATPRHAAAVILVRHPRDPEIYWVQRQPHLTFLGGFHSFPGGRLDKGDDPAVYGLGAAFDDAPLRFCALRELYEETGVLIGGRFVDIPDFITGVKTGVLTPDLSALMPAGRWVTPPFSPARFDTTFYLAWLPEGPEPVAFAGELAFGEWIRPEAALERWNEGRALLAPPTLYAIRGLCAAVLMASGNDEPLELAMAAEQLTGSEEANGGPVTRIEMRPGFFLFPMKTRTLPPATHTNAFLVGGASLVLVDPGSDDPGEIERLLQFIDRLGGEGRSVTEIWLTHQHPDHVGGVAVVASRLGVPVRAHPLTATRLAGLGVPIEPVLEDDLVRELPGRPGWRLRVVHTPGHAVGHLAFFEEVSGTLIAGDMVSGVGWIMIDPPEGEMAPYLDSLRRLAGLGASALFPSHGPPTTGVVDRLEAYLAHRLEREAKVVGALKGGQARSIEDILADVYDDVAPDRLGLARRSLLSHLIKLESEGSVISRGEMWQWR
ncbi:MAG: MBL fold metallo-hydrolase [Candidatus Eisenbacteria bacterium]|nr:MBL fold metallo-hydrolase [Candidatus Eisenbacteria bacterium]